MFIGISGRARCGKDLLTAKYAYYHPKLVDYNFKRGFGNVTLYGMPYNYTYLKSRELINRLFKTFNSGETNTLFVISEAHRILNPRSWSQWTKEDTFNLSGIFQDDKQWCAVIYNYNNGKPGEDLLGVDKMVRATTWLDIKITSDEDSIKKKDMLDYTKYTYVRPPTVHRLRNVSRYFELFNTREAVL